MKKYIIGIALSLVLPAFVFAYFQPATLTNGVDRVAVFSQEVANKYFGMGYVLDGQKVGSAAGNTFEQQVDFDKGFIKGGKIYNASTTLTVARTITASEICNNSTITVNSAAVAGTLSAASLDLTLAATSTLFKQCLKTNGDEITFDLLNQSPTAATTTEIVAGTGCQIIYGVADGDATIPGQKGATITVKRVTDWLADGGSKDCVVRVYEWN